MKKSSILFVLCLALFSFLFTSCNGKTGDILEGTWKSDWGINSSTGADEMPEQTYVFDGKGNCTFTSVQEQYEIFRTAKGTYKLVDAKYVHTYLSITNNEGITQVVEEVLELDTSNKPYSLNYGAIYDNDGNIIRYLKYIKQ